MIATYLGSRGHNLMQQFLPNTYPAGSVTPCATCPAGFAYLTSTGRSLRNAGQVQVRRRLRNGFTASVQYTLAKATDDAAAFAGATLAGFGMAQNWLDLDAEYGRSAFDQRHQVDGAGAVHERRRHRRRLAGGRLARAAAEGLDVRGAADDRQRPAADAGVPGARARHRVHQHAAAAARPARRWTTWRTART